MSKKHCRHCGLVINLWGSREGLPGAFKAGDGSWVRWRHHPGKRHSRACKNAQPKEG